MILLTSGTTDVPRRVPATHGNVLATCFSSGMGARPDHQVTAGSARLPPTSYSVWRRIIESLISGGSAIVATAL